MLKRAGSTTSQVWHFRYGGAPVQFMSLLVLGKGKICKIFLSHGKVDERQDFSPEELIPPDPGSCPCLAGCRALVTPKLAVFLAAPPPR